ncbi:unnamed protein product, partial [Ectocarpus fasciculatus]
MAPLQISYPSVEFKNQLRDGVAPIEACAFNTPRREFLAVDASALRVWSLKRVVKTIMAPSKVSSPAIAAFCCEKNDLYIVVYGGRNLAGSDASRGGAYGGGCFVYDAKLRLLCRFSPCDCEVASAVFYPSTGALIISGRDGIMRIFRISSRRLPPAPVPHGTTATKPLQQVTARGVQRLDGPTTGVAMEILEIDAASGLVVGLSGTEAFLWRLPTPQQTSVGVSVRGSVGEVEVPTLPNTALCGAANDGFEGRRYQYLGSMPDLHSSEVTAIGVREPLLATGLASGRIFLWRINASSSCSLKRIVLAVFDGHDAFPILTLRLLRSRGASDQGVMSPSSPAAPDGGRLQSGKGVDAYSGVINNGEGESSEDWSIISGGGDGTVAHLSVVGLASARETASGVAEAGVELHVIGEYEASRKTRSALNTFGSATSGDRLGNSRFAANRRPGVSHIMAIRLSAGEEARVFGSGLDARHAGAHTAGRGTSLSRERGAENFQAPAKGSSWAEANVSATGEGGGGGGGRDFCIAVSGGLVSVLEVVEPLQHVGWVGRETTTALTAGVYEGGGKKREVARMARVPSVWRPATAEDVDCAADDFMVMCDDGWFGWYHGCHGKFELVSRLKLPAPGSSHFAEATVAGSDATCFAVSPIPAKSRQTSANGSVVSCKSSLHAGAPESARIVVGYSDGSIACASLPAPSSSTNHPRPAFGTGSRHHEGKRGERTVRRVRRAGGGREGGDGGGAAAIEAAITALCPLSAPLVVAGDSDGRLALWTTSSALPPHGRQVPLLWEDRNAHRGAVIAIERVEEAIPSTPVSGLSCNRRPQTAQRTSRPREWVVSAGSGGEIRVWNVPLRWPGRAGAGGGKSSREGLEFCATLLTNASICSFSCAFLFPSDAYIGGGGGTGGCGGNGSFGQDHREDQERERSHEQGTMGEKRRCRPGGRAEATGGRLYCVAGSDNGFVQAWELSLDGEEGVGGQPLWSEKTHDAAATKMDMWELYPSDPDGPRARTTTGLNISSSTTTGVSEVCATGPKAARVIHQQKEKESHGGLESNHAPPPSPPHSQAVGKGGRHDAAKLLEKSAAECLVLSAALDRTLCVFRARHGRGLQLLRRLNVPCSPRGVPGALFVGIPVESASEGVAGTKLKAVVVLAAAGGELTQLGVEYKIGGKGLKRPSHARSMGPNESVGDPRSLSADTTTNGTEAAAGRGQLSTPGKASPFNPAEGQLMWPASTVHGGRSILDKVPKWVTPPTADTTSRTRTAARTAVGNRSFPAGAQPSTSSSGQPGASRPRSSNYVGSGVGYRQHLDKQQHLGAPAAADEVDMMGHWDYPSSEGYASGATASGTLLHPSIKGSAAPVSIAFSVADSSTTLNTGGTGDEQSRSGAALSATAMAGGRSLHAGSAGGAGGADSQGDRGTKRLRPEARDTGINGQPGPRCQRQCAGMVDNKKFKDGGGRSGGGNGYASGFVATQQAANSLSASSTGTTKDGLAGNAGRWQQRLGITMEGNSSGPGENGGDEGTPPHEATTATELMQDAALREAFAARGRHKKSPVLAREVKATLKAWSPGVVEACSRADFSAAMGGLTSRKTVSFQRVCEIAAAVLEATGGVAARKAAGQAIGCTSVAASSTVASWQGNNARRRDHHPLLSAKQCDSGSRPARYRNMAKFKTRLQYNSMGERVIVRVAVDDIDAFAARSRQGSHLLQDQQKQKHQQCFDGGAGGWGHQVVQPDGKDKSTSADNNNEDGNDTRSSNGRGDGDRKAFGGEDRVGIDEERAECVLEGRQSSPPSLPPKNVSKSLGFGWPDFSSVDSKVLDHMYSEDDLDSLARPSRATAANLGCVPAGLRGVWSRQGSCMFSSWSASHHAERPADQLPAEGTDGTDEVLGEGECVRLVREVLDGRAAAREASLMACRRFGRCAPDSHAIVVGDGVYGESSRGENCGATACFDQEENGSCCPASRVETLGVALYNDFRRRYGLQRTAEERVAGLLGAVLEHGRASPVLRLFARMVGAPPDASGEGGRWPSQTSLEDAHLGLEPQLVNLVTTARNWLVTRGFMTADGPWAGVGENGKTERDGGFGIGWKTTIVARTHAAMCASALLTPGWGAGHQIMGAAEQAVLELPTVTPSGPGDRRWAGRRGQQPWSEFVDGEAFLEALLLVVLCARKLSRTTNDGLFGRRAVAGHSFLPAKARDINAGASAAATEHEKHATQVGRKTATEQSLESLLDAVSKSPPSLLATPASGELYRTHIASAGDNSGGETNGVSGSGGFRGNQAGDAHTERESVVPNQNDDNDNKNNNNNGKNGPANNDPPYTEMEDGGGERGTRFRNRENELGEGGKILQRLKPLLDNFIREDTQRTGTLPAADFRRVLCEGHGGLWPGLGTSVRSDIGFVFIPEESAAEFIDPRLTSLENDAARALVRRFMDIFDGQACYLDVWITLYHAVFRTGKIVPFTELPSICEMQLRGADTAHWQALLEYLETAGIGNATAKHCISDRSSGETGEWEGWPVGVRALSSQGQPPASMLDHGGEDASKQEGGSHVATMAKGSSTPALGLLRTAIDGGAASAHNVTAGTAATRPRPSTAANNAPTPVKTAKGPVEWPRAGWGPGSLTVSRPPRAAGPSETALSTAAVTLALSAPRIHGGAGVGVCGAAGVLREGGLESEGIRICGGGVVTDGVAFVGGGVALEEGRPTRSPHHPQTPMQRTLSSQPLAGEGSWDGGGGCVGRGGSREGRQEAETDVSAVKDRSDHQLLPGEGNAKAVRPNESTAGEVSNGSSGIMGAGGFTSDGEKKKIAENDDVDHLSIAGTGGGEYADGDGILEKRCSGVEEECDQQQQQQQQEQHQQTSREFSDSTMTEGDAIIPNTPVDRGLNGSAGPDQERQDVPAQKGNGSDNNRDDGWGVDWSQQAHPSRFDEDSMSGGVLLYNLDCGTLEPPSPQPPSPERQGGGRDDVGAERGQQSTGTSRRKKRREKRTMTSLYVRCPFLDPVKSKHAYRVPRGGRLNAPPPMPIFREAVDSASMAAQLYSSISSVKAKKAAADAAVHVERQQALGSRGRKNKDRNRHRDAGGGTGEPLVLHFPRSLKEATLREGSSKSRERRHDKAGRYTPGPGGGGGRGGEEAHMAAAEDRESWTGQRQRRKS